MYRQSLRYAVLASACWFLGTTARSSSAGLVGLSVLSADLTKNPPTVNSSASVTGMVVPSGAFEGTAKAFASAKKIGVLGFGHADAEATWDISLQITGDPGASAKVNFSSNLSGTLSAAGGALGTGIAFDSYVFDLNGTRIVDQSKVLVGTIASSFTSSVGNAKSGRLSGTFNVGDTIEISGSLDAQANAIVTPPIGFASAISNFGDTAAFSVSVTAVPLPAAWGPGLVGLALMMAARFWTRTRRLY